MFAGDVESRARKWPPSHHLELEDLGLLPTEVLVCEVAILGCLEVDGLGKVELLNNHTGSHIKVSVDDLDQLVRSLV